MIAPFLITWNIAVFALYGADKYKARKNARRVSESALLFCAFLMGGAGAALGMAFFRHKTRKWKFRILVPLAIAANVAVFVIFAAMMPGVTDV